MIRWRMRGLLKAAIRIATGAIVAPVYLCAVIFVAVLGLFVAAVSCIWYVLGTPFVLAEEVAESRIFTTKKERENHPAVKLYRWASKEPDNKEGGLSFAEPIDRNGGLSLATKRRK